MTKMMIAQGEIEVGADGFFQDPSTWREEMIPELARLEGIDSLSPRHLEVIRFMREQYETKGGGPSVRALSKASGISIKELYELFPKGPAKQAAKIAGIPKPIGCI